MSKDALKTSLAETQGRAPWAMLKGHADRGGLIMVAPKLDLLRVGLAVAQERGDLIGAWLSEGKQCVHAAYPLRTLPAKTVKSNLGRTQMR